MVDVSEGLTSSVAGWLMVHACSGETRVNVVARIIACETDVSSPLLAFG